MGQKERIHNNKSEYTHKKKSLWVKITGEDKKRDLPDILQVALASCEPSIDQHPSHHDSAPPQNQCSF